MTITFLSVAHSQLAISDILKFLLCLYNLLTKFPIIRHFLILTGKITKMRKESPQVVHVLIHSCNFSYTIYSMMTNQASITVGAIIEGVKLLPECALLII